MRKKISMSSNMVAMGKLEIDKRIHAVYLCWPIFQLVSRREFDRKKTGLSQPMGGARKFASTLRINLIKRTIP